MQKRLGRPVVKIFNNIYADHLQNKGLPAGTPGRISLPVAGDDAAAKQKVMALVQELGFDAVDDGSLHESWRQQPGTPSYGADLPADKLREHLTSLGTKRTEAQHAEYMANHAKQEQAMAAQGNNLSGLPIHRLAGVDDINVAPANVIVVNQTVTTSVVPRLLKSDRILASFGQDRTAADAAQFGRKRTSAAYA